MSTELDRPSAPVAGWRRWLPRLPDRRLDTDDALMAAMAAAIEAAAWRFPFDPGASWKPGEPLRLLFAGYAGSRNTGADVRVEEMIRQVRFLLGDELADLSLLTIDPAKTAGYFRAVRQIELPPVFPRFVTQVVHEHHGVIACEGSMFKSKFANALSTLMVGALGVAGVEGKVAVAYGGEAGAMDPGLESLVRRYAKDALVICRNEESRGVLGRLGVPTESGTDTAWTFEPGRPGAGRRLLTAAGWDERRPLLVVCPINAFWWPVKPDLSRYVAMKATGAGSEHWYTSVYFHRSGEDVDRRQDQYLGALAGAVRSWEARTRGFTALVGMEALDARAAEDLSERLGGRPIFSSLDHDLHALVDLLRQADALVSSRYHALVCSMAGRVPSVGVTMDERIRNLMADRGTPDLCLTVDQDGLEAALEAALRRLERDREGLARGIGATVVRNLRRMGAMGQVFVDHLRQRHPELPLRDGLGRRGEVWAHLPPLAPRLRALVETHGDAP
jgi:polysaccharide pyruvyl transferase WcaK-like protein